MFEFIKKRLLKNRSLRSLTSDPQYEPSPLYLETLEDRMMLSGSQVEVSDQLLFDSASGLVSFDSDPEGSSVSLEDSIVYSLLGGRGYYTEQFYQFDEIGEFVSYSMQLSTEAFAELLIESENENFTASYTLTDQFGNELASGQTESGVAFLIVERAVKDRILQLDIQSRSEVLTKVKVSALKNAGFDQVTLDSNSPSSYAQPQILDSYSLPVGFGNESLLLFGQHIHQDGNTYEFELTEGVASDILFAPELNSVGFGSSIELELYDPNGDRVVKIINGGSLGRFSSKIDTGTRTNDGSAVADSEWRINDFVPRQSGKYKLKVTATRFSPFGGSNVARTLDYAVLISRGAAIESGANTGTQPTPRSLDVIKSAVGAVSAQGVNRYFGFDSNRNAIVELDFNSGEFVRVFAVLPASENKASGLALANSKLILGLGDKVFEFETLTGELVRELSLAGAEISSLAFFKDEIFVLDSNSGNEIIVLDYQTGEVNRRLVLDTIENSKLGDPLAIVADTSRFGVVFETNDSPRKSFATVDQATDKIDTLWDLNYESGDEIYSATLANSRLIIHGTSRGFRDVTSWELASGPNFVADGVFVAQREESGPIYDSISSIAATDNGADSYSFTATTGETIGVQVDTSSNDDPAFVLGVEILTPDLTRIELVEIGVVDSPTTIEYLANQSGKYIVRLFAINGPGNYSVSVVGSTPTLNEVSVIENSAVPRFRDSTITIGFSESLNLSSFDRFDVLLNGLPAQELSTTATNGDRFRFDFSNVLVDDGEYELSIAGNAFNGLSGSQNAVYRTSVTYDTIGPRVENTSIPNVLTGPLTNFTVDFNEDINPDSIESSFAIYVRGPAGNVQPLQKTVIGNRVEIVMDETSVAQPGQYRLIVDDIVEDLVRNRMDQNQDGQPFDGYEFLFQIENPELESSQLVAPSQVTTGQEFRLDWVDTNAGVIPTGRSWTDSIYLSEDTILQENDLLLSTRLVPETAAGSQREVFSIISLPDVPTGDYYFLIATDSNDEVLEIDESNNLISSGLVSVFQAEPTIEVSLAQESDTGISNDDGLTNVASPTLSVTINRSGDIGIDINQDGDPEVVLLGQPAGTYQLTAPELPDGLNVVTALFVPEVGNPIQQEITITIDTERPRFTPITKELNAPLSEIEFVFSETIDPSFSESFAVEIYPPDRSILYPFVSLEGKKVVADVNLVEEGFHFVFLSGEIRDLAGNLVMPEIIDDTFVDVFDELVIIQDEFTIIGDLVPPVLVSANPFELTNSDVDTLTFNFDEPIVTDGLSFSITDPNGQLVDLSSTQTEAVGNTLEITFAPLSAEGSYTVNLANVSDRFGNRLVTPFEDQFTIDQTGPSILESRVDPDESRGPAYFDLVFDSLPSAFNYQDIVLTSPNSQRFVDFVAPTYLGDNTYRLSIFFDLNSYENGEYTVTIAPDVVYDGAQNPLENGPYEFAFAVSLPDFTLVDQDSIVSPQSAFFGQSFSLEWTIDNLGTSTNFASWTDRVYLSSDDVLDENDILVSSVSSTSTVEPNGELTISVTDSIPLTNESIDGDYFLIVSIDDDDELDESDEDNNRVSVPINLSVPLLPDLVVQTSSISAPAMLTPGTSFTLDWTVENVGNAATEGGWVERIYICPDGTGENCQLLGSVIQSEDLTNDGGPLARSVELDLPLFGFSGDVFFLIEMDALNEQVESGESNQFVSQNSTFIQPLLTLDSTPEVLTEGDPSRTVVLTRNGDLSQPLNVTLQTDNPRLDLPTEVTIPTGQYSIRFDVELIDDQVVDGEQLITITASAEGFNNEFLYLNTKDNDFPVLSLNAATTELEESEAIEITVERNLVSDQPVSIQLSTNSDQIQFPAFITIESGETTATFNVTVLEDTLIELFQSVEIVASSPGLVAGTIELAIGQSDVPAVELVFPSLEVPENADRSLLTGVVTLDRPFDQDVLVELSSSSSQLSVPSRVTVLAGETAVEFPFVVADDQELNGSRNVDVFAQVIASDSTTRLDDAADSKTLTILDDESPSLSIELENRVLREGQSTIATLRRNTDVTVPLEVHLATDLGAEIQFESTATFGVGESEIEIVLTGIEDGVIDGDNLVSLTVSAEGFSSGVTTLTVTDTNRADLDITQISAPLNGTTGQSVEVNWTVTNNGLESATGSWLDRVFLSSDALFGDDLLIGQVGYDGALPIGNSYDRTLQVDLPFSSGEYFFFVQTDAGISLVETVEPNNLASSGVSVEAAYTATVSTAIEIAPAGTSVLLTGSASRPDGSPAAFEQVDVHINVRGTRRVLTATTDINGDYEVTFTPLPGEGGAYTVGAVHPGEEVALEQDSFMLVGIQAEPSDNSIRVIEAGDAVSQTLTVRNLADVELTELNVELLNGPSNLEIEFSVLNDATTIGELGTVTIEYSVQAIDASTTDTEFQFRISTAEAPSIEVDVAVEVIGLTPILTTNVSQLTMGAVIGDVRYYEFEIENSGGAESGDIQVFVPNVQWFQLVSTETIESLGPSERTTVVVRLTPPDDLQPQSFTGTIEAYSSETLIRLPITVNVVSDAITTLTVSVEDEYTYFAEGTPPLAEATVTITNAVTGEEFQPLVTDQSGIISFEEIPEGIYDVVVTAERHNTYRNTIRINAGEENSITAFLPRQTVEYNWTVTPTEIEDRTEITLETTFETNVPVPVVTITPGVINFEELNWVNGEALIEFEITNHGLIATDDVVLDLPVHSLYSFETVTSQLGTVAAKATLVVPVSIKKLQENAGKPVFRSTNAGVTGGINPDGGVWGQAPININVKGTDQLLGYQRFTIKKIDKPILVENVGKLHWSVGARGEVVLPTNIELAEGCNLEWVQIITHDDESPGYFGSPLSTPHVDKPSLGYSDRSRDDDQPFVDPPSETGKYPEMSDGPTPPNKKIGNRLEFESYLVLTGDCVGAGKFLPIAGFEWGMKKIPFVPTDDPRFVGDVEVTKFAPIDVSEAKREAIETGLTNGMFEGWSLAPADFDWSGCLIPEAVDDLFVICEGESLDGDVTSFNGFGFDSLICPEVEMISSPGNAREFEWFGDGRFRYVPRDGFSGTDSFTYLVSNGKGEFDTAEVTIVVEPCYLAGALTNTYFCGTEVLQRNPITFIVCPEGCRTVPAEVSGGRTTTISQPGPARGTLTSNSAVPGSQVQVQCVIPSTLGPTESTTTRSSAMDFRSTSLDDGVCAQVQLQLSQSAVQTREAFDANLEISNLTEGELSDLGVEIIVTNSGGEDVTDLFGIAPPELDGLSAVDGSGTLRANSTGSSSWLILPSSEAAPDTVTEYFVSGTLKYTEDGIEVIAPLSEVAIMVYPQAELSLDYFLQRDVISDDPFTSEIEEAQPFTLGVLVQNDGGGAANNLRIESAQPRIVENEKGLLVDFEIIGTSVNGEDAQRSLTANIGTIDPGATAVAQWQMESTLQGLFVDYNATFEHVSPFGDNRFSLIKSVEIHELIRTVDAEVVDGDTLTDFLVNDLPDPNDLPDTLYFSDGSIADVGLGQNVIVDANPTLSDLVVNVTAEMTEGWSYLRMDDPSFGEFTLVSVQRSDGTFVDSDNFWQTDRTFIGQGQRPILEDNIHLLDFESTGAYTFTFSNGDLAGPSVVEISGVTPNPTSETIDSLTVQFDERLNDASFDPVDLTLFKNGAAVALSGISISYLSDSIYQIEGLGTFTADDAVYEIVIDTTELTDQVGNEGLGPHSFRWVKGETLPTILSLSAPNGLITSATDSIDIEFSKPINGSTLSVEDFSLTRDGEELIDADVTISQINDTTYRLGNLARITGSDGSYEFFISATGIEDLVANVGIGDSIALWTVDQTAPVIVDVIAPATNPRNTVVQQIDVEFSEPIDISSFDIADLTLTRDGQVENLISGDDRVEIIDRGDNRYRIRGISWVQGFTADPQVADFTLTVDGAGIQDLAGNSGIGTDATTWTIDLDAPGTPSNLRLLQDGEELISGRANGLNAMLVGELSETGLTLVVEDSVTGTELAREFNSDINFEIPIEFASLGRQSLTAKLIDLAGNTTDFVIGHFFVESYPVTIESVSGIPAEFTSNSVDSLTIQFTSPINAKTLTRDSLSLTRNSGTNRINEDVSIRPLGGDGLQFAIEGLAGITSDEGFYQIQIDLTNIESETGEAGFGSYTNSWTLDSTSPTSFVRALAPNQDQPSFILNISGDDPGTSDGVKSSDVESYDVFVSTDGDSFELLQSTDSNFIEFNGDAGQKYYFYSLAKDNAGNVEASKTLADAQTDTPSVIIFSDSEELTTNEDGSRDTFGVTLGYAPQANVEIDVASLDETEGTVSANQIIFTPENWDTEQFIDVNGQDDEELDGDTKFEIALDSRSDDGDFDGIAFENLNVVNLDNEVEESLKPLFNAGGNPEEGSPLTFTANLDDFKGNPDDVQFSWEFGDGSTGTGQSVSHTFVDNGSYDVSLTVLYDGQSASATETIEIANVAPFDLNLETNAEASSAPSLVTLVGAFDEMGTHDTHTAEINWGDGVTETVTLENLEFSIQHQYEAIGNYAVSVTVLDNDGGSTSGSINVFVAGTGIIDRVLYYVGSDSDDDIRVSVRRNQLQIRSRSAETLSYSLDELDGMKVMLGNGDDRIRVDRRLSKTIEIDAGDGNNYVDARLRSAAVSVVTGDGNDVVYTGRGNDVVETGGGDDRIRTDRGDDRVIAGSGNDEVSTGRGNDFVDAGSGNDFVRTDRGDDIVFGGLGDDYIRTDRGNDIAVGGAGNDWIRADRGRNLYIGGTGQDSIGRRISDTILVAGTTSYDSDLSSLNAIRSEWSSDRDVGLRRANVISGSGPFLTSQINLIEGERVFDDNVSDFIFRGFGGQSLLFVSNGLNADLYSRFADHELRIL